MILKKTIFLLFIVAGCFYTCKKDDFEGPSIEVIYGDFKILDTLKLTNVNPNFSLNEEVGFYCKFNKNVNWKISIRGKNSNSLKELTGFSNEIDSNIITWTGSSSKVPFFKKEQCTIELTIDNEVDTIQDSLTIIGTKIYDGILVADFENGIPQNAIVSWTNNIGLKTFTVASDNPLFGNNYFQMGGKVNWDWALGKIDFELDLSSTTVQEDNLYINIGILSDTIDLHTGQFINIFISESNAPFNDNLSNNSADIFDADEEVYKLKVPVDWDGWKLKSFPYSDFDAVSPNSTNINFSKNPKDIKGIRIATQACPSSGSNSTCSENFNKIVRTDIDYVIFTENEKLLDQE